MSEYRFIKWFEEFGKEDVFFVGGKGVNFGEFIKVGILVLFGFCVIVEVYKYFVENVKFEDGKIFQEWIMEIISQINVDDFKQFQENIVKIRQKIIEFLMFLEIVEEIERVYKEFSVCFNKDVVYVVVCLFVIVEDFLEVFFVGQQEIYFDVYGVDDVIDKVKKCWVLFWIVRVIFYRVKQGFDYSKVYFLVVVQKMVNSEKSGVMFIVNLVINNRNEIMINVSWGFGEVVVSGSVILDEYIVEKGIWKIKEKFIVKKEVMVVRNFEIGKGIVYVKVVDYFGLEWVEKQVFIDEQIIEVVKMGVKIEEYYGWLQDIEWVYDKDDGKFYIVQSRLIIIFKEEIKVEEVEGIEEVEVIFKGFGVLLGIGVGRVVVIFDVSEIDKVKEGDVFVIIMINLDMVLVMKRVFVIVIDEGGRISYVVIVSCEFGILVVVGIKEVIKKFKIGDYVIVDGICGVVYKGIVKSFVEKKEEKVVGVVGGQVVVVGVLFIIVIKVKVNVLMFEVVERVVVIGVDGVGFFRVEYMIFSIGQYLIKFIKEGKFDEFVEKFVDGIRIVVVVFYLRLVWYRIFDVLINEFKEMFGGEDELDERNLMFGWCGIRCGFDQLEFFKVEFIVIKKVVEEGYNNIGVMFLFVGYLEQIRKVKEIVCLVGFELYKDVEWGIMIEVLVVVFIIEDFIKEGIDFVSFGINDFIQYIFVIDRDNDRIVYFYDEIYLVVFKFIKYVIKVVKKYGVEISICGQVGSDLKMVKIFVRFGIDSIFVNLDVVEFIRKIVVQEEQKIFFEVVRKRFFEEEDEFEF